MGQTWLRGHRVAHHGGVTGQAGFLDERTLVVVVRVGAFRCGIEAADVERLSELPRAPDRDRPLAELLSIPADGPPAAWVYLQGAAPALGVDAVLGVENVAGRPFLRIPALCRLERPAFRGCWSLPDGLLPGLDTRGVFAGVAT